jgi:FMN phosphatase YigB (HAD superfamily)
MVVRSLSHLMFSTALVTLVATAPAQAMQKTYTPANTTVVYDIDNVLLERSAPIYQTLWDYRWDLAKNIICPSLVYKVGQLLYQNAAGGAYYELFKAQAPRLAEMVERITLEKKPVAGMPELITAVHARAFKLAIASNMSAKDFVFYQHKFPTLFGLFDYAKVIKYNEQGKALCKKPSLVYFKELKNELADHDLAKENFVFIDDRMDNVVASSQEGFKGIVFKNAAQLKADLNNMDIL